ncbi:MAG: cyclodeaminase/cyclohydrolase family protein [Gemmatimonadales bacterium]|nr:cyclodeaminase/cyclohydrolase family protein [Gemmatimonadales bacterium]MBA3554387.1 cyclodeaminase/cyclohydrolase family protein [Gemmatimonadales bacterium]
MPTAAAAGGAAAAVSGALAAAVVEMVAGMTGAREKYAAVHRRAAEAREQGTALREELLGLAREDAEAFAGFERALAMPRGTEAERASRGEAKRAALREGARVQFAVLEGTADVAALAEWLTAEGLATAMGDSSTAGFLAAGAARSAYWAVRSNLGEIGADLDAREWLAEGLKLLERAEAAEGRIRQLLNERVR